MARERVLQRRGRLQRQAFEQFLVLAVEILSELGVGHVLRRALIAVPFALAALPVLFTVPGPALLTLPIGPWDLTITGPGPKSPFTAR